MLWRARHGKERLVKLSSASPSERSRYGKPESGERLWGMPACASLSALALGEGDVEGEWRHSQETRFHSRETRTLPAAPHTHSLGMNAREDGFYPLSLSQLSLEFCPLREQSTSMKPFLTSVLKSAAVPPSAPNSPRVLACL